MSDYFSHGSIIFTISMTNVCKFPKLRAGKYRSGEEARSSRKLPVAETVLTKTVAILMSASSAASAATTAASLHGDPTGPPLALQPDPRPVANSPLVVGAPSVIKTMYFKSAVEVFSVSVHFAMACSVFVQPPVYFKPSTSVIAAAGSSSAGPSGSGFRMKARVAKSTTLYCAVFSVPIEAVSSLMNSVAKSFVSV